jgi:subtilisin family serine protease
LLEVQYIRLNNQNGKMVSSLTHRHLQTSSLSQTRLERLLGLTHGNPHFRIALIDGMIDSSHSGLLGAYILKDIPSRFSGSAPLASAHATFIASILVGREDGLLGICRECTLLNIPVVDADFELGSLPSDVAAAKIARAIVRSVELGASVIQLSMEFSPNLGRAFEEVVNSLQYASKHGVRAVIAAGNSAILGGSAVLNSMGVVPVAMADQGGFPDSRSNLGLLIGARGLLAPGVDIPGATLPTGIGTGSGSSFSAAFVTGTFSLLCSLFPKLSRDLVWDALLTSQPRSQCRASIVPPLLNADASLLILEKLNGKFL